MKISEISFSELYSMYLYVYEDFNMALKPDERRKRVDKVFWAIKKELNKRVYNELDIGDGE